MVKKTKRLKLRDSRKYMGVWIEEGTHEVLMRKAYQEGNTLSQYVRGLLDKAAEMPF